MTSGPLVGSCPDWNGSIEPSKDREFRNRVRTAYRDAAEYARKKVFRNDQACWWHFTLFQQLVPVSYYAGQFRKDDPHVPCLAMDVEVNGVPGANFQDVVRLMDELEERARLSIVQTELHWAEMSPVDRARRLSVLLAALIGRFIQIHPFVNGNGRTSRILWAWGLARFGVQMQCRIHPNPGVNYIGVMRQAMLGDYGPLALSILRHLTNHPPSRPT